MDGLSAVRLHQAGRRRHRRGGRTGRGGARCEHAEARTARGLTHTGMAAHPPPLLLMEGLMAIDRPHYVLDHKYPHLELRCTAWSRSRMYHSLIGREHDCTQ